MLTSNIKQHFISLSYTPITAAIPVQFHASLRWRTFRQANDYLFVNESLDRHNGLRIMPVVLPGGSMANCVRHSVLARLNADAGLPFFFPLLIGFPKPLI
ncbi:PyrBI operon leader peptide [Klebsiella pneumoniae]|nr:PyrBI operon leader peptide [Klebsiella pneumoniae]